MARRCAWGSPAEFATDTLLAQACRSRVRLLEEIQAAQDAAGMGSLAGITPPPCPMTVVYLDLCWAKGQSDGWGAYTNLSAYRVLMKVSPGSPQSSV